MKSIEEFKEEVIKAAKKRPTNWRRGQAVFNYIDATYGVARTVQFQDRIDCFYVDEFIEDFISAAYKRLADESK